MSLHIDIAMPPTLQVDEVSPEAVAATSVVAMERKRRGKAIKWKYVKKYATIAEAKENFTRGNLTQKEQFLGRKYNGKTSAIYINCQKVICGCRKKWRLVSCVTASHVVLEETSEDHSHHDLFVRSGGHGLSQEQITLTQEALLLNSRMKPLQIVNFFCDRAARDLALGMYSSFLNAQHLIFRFRDSLILESSVLFDDVPI